MLSDLLKLVFCAFAGAMAVSFAFWASTFAGLMSLLWIIQILTGG